jgi:hypothetical protein
MPATVGLDRCTLHRRVVWGWTLLRCERLRSGSQHAVGVTLLLRHGEQRCCATYLVRLACVDSQPTRCALVATDRAGVAIQRHGSGLVLQAVVSAQRVSGG